VRDWQVPALTDPPDLGSPWHSVATVCGSRHPIGCPVQVARRGELCPRCAAGVGTEQSPRASGRQTSRSAEAVQRLELLDNRSP
jgi:hypothetical protein